MSDTPPSMIISAAERVAARSPCAKSKRGVIAFSFDEIYGEGCNGPPAGGCDGSEACRRDCGKRCVHAEMRAIRYVRDACDLLHVKIGPDGRVVAGGGPSCWQCSREIVDCRLVTGVWLYEQPVFRSVPSQGLHSQVVEYPDGVWRYYTAEEFHRATLDACGIGGPQ